MTLTLSLDEIPAERAAAMAIAGGKAANLAVMRGARPAGPARLRHHDRGLPLVPRRRLAGWPRRGAAGPDDRARGRRRPAVRRCRRPAARQRPVRGAGLDARDDGHHPRPRPDAVDDGRSGPLDRRRGVRPGVPGTARDRLPDHRRRRRRPRRPVAAAPTRDRGRLPVVGKRPRGHLPAQGGHPGRSRDSGDGPGDGLRQPRPGLRDRRRLHPRSGDRRAGPLRRRPVRRSGRGRGRRDPRDRADRGARVAAPGGRRGAACPCDRPRAPLRRHVRHRVHDRGRAPLDAPGPGRQAQPASGPADGRRHGRGPRLPVDPRRGRRADPTAARRPADDRHGPERRRSAADDRPAGLAGLRHAARSRRIRRRPSRRPIRGRRRSSCAPRRRRTTSTAWPGRRAS